MANSKEIRENKISQKHRPDYQGDGAGFGCQNAQSSSPSIGLRPYAKLSSSLLENLASTVGDTENEFFQKVLNGKEGSHKNSYDFGQSKQRFGRRSEYKLGEQSHGTYPSRR
jgi:hypothetical protein